MAFQMQNFYNVRIERGVRVLTIGAGAPAGAGGQIGGGRPEDMTIDDLLRLYESYKKEKVVSGFACFLLGGLAWLILYCYEDCSFAKFLNHESHGVSAWFLIWLLSSVVASVASLLASIRIRLTFGAKLVCRAIFAVLALSFEGQFLDVPSFFAAILMSFSALSMCWFVAIDYDTGLFEAIGKCAVDALKAQVVPMPLHIGYAAIGLFTWGMLVAEHRLTDLLGEPRAFPIVE